MMSVLDQVRRIQPRIEISDLIGSPRCDELISDGHTFDRSYHDEPEFDGPAPEEEHEGHELMACMTLDSFAPPTMTFVEFLANQARLCSLRDEHPWFTWLGKQIATLADRARLLKAQTPDAYEARDEVLVSTSHAAAALDSIRMVGRLVDAPCLADELRRAAETIERTLRAR